MVISCVTSTRHEENSPSSASYDSPSSRHACPCISSKVRSVRVLFIGTQFSILYTSMYSLAEAATHPIPLPASHAPRTSIFRELTHCKHQSWLPLLDQLASAFPVPDTTHHQ